MSTSKGKDYNKTMEEDLVREKNDVTKQDKGKDFNYKRMEKVPVREDDDVTEQDKKLEGLVAAAVKEILKGDDDLVITISKRKKISADQNETENKAKQNSPEGPTDGGKPKENWFTGLTRGFGSMALMFGASMLGTVTGESVLTRIQAKEMNKKKEHEVMKEQKEAEQEAAQAQTQTQTGYPSSITIKPEISVSQRFALLTLSKG